MATLGHVGWAGTQTSRRLLNLMQLLASDGEAKCVYTVDGCSQTHLWFPMVHGTEFGAHG